MSKNFDSISELVVTALDGGLKIKLELSKELKAKLEQHYNVDCAYKLIVETVLDTVDFEHSDVTAIG